METKSWKDIKDKARTAERIARLDAEVAAEASRISYADKVVEALDDMDRDGTQTRAGIVAEAIRAAVLAEREACSSAVAALSEHKDRDLGADWDGGWEAAIETAVATIRDRK